MYKKQILETTPTKSSTGADWVNFHKSLVNAIGKKNANEMWKSYWAKLGNGDANTGELRAYLKDNGINLSGENGLLSDVVDFKYDVTDTISHVFSAGKYVAIGLGLLIFIPLGIALFNVALNAGKIAKDTAKGYSKMPIK